MDPLLVWLNVLILLVAFIALVVGLSVYSSRKRADIMVTQPLLMIDEVGWRKDDRGMYKMFRVENRNNNPFHIEKVYIKGYDFTTKYHYIKEEDENDVVILKFYMQPDQTMNFRIRIIYRDFNNKSHVMMSVRMDMEGGALTYEAEGTKFILTKTK
jgi:PDZ domain-containing secreted protein